MAIANELFSKFRLPPIEDLSQCTASVLVALYEGILGDKLLGKMASRLFFINYSIWNPYTSCREFTGNHSQRECDFEMD